MQKRLDKTYHRRKYAKRLPQIHMKDIRLADGTLMELGCGDVDLPGCVEAARGSICEWLIYEQDTCNMPQFESAKISIAYLRKLLGK